MVILKGLTLIFDKYDELKQFAASIKNKLIFLGLNAVNSTISKYLLNTTKIPMSLEQSSNFIKEVLKKHKIKDFAITLWIPPPHPKLCCSYILLK